MRQFLILLLTICSPSGAVEIDLAKCLELASQKSPQVIQTALTEAKSVQNKNAVVAGRLPRLSVAGAISVTDTPSTQLPDANNIGLVLEQNLFPFSPGWVLAQQAQTLAEVAHFDKIQNNLDVSLWVKQTYFSILNGNASLLIMDEVKKESEKLLHSVLPKFSIGRVPPYDLVKAKSALATLLRERLLVESALAGQKSQLAQALGFSATEDLELKNLDVEPIAPHEMPVNETVSANPNLLSLSATIAASRLGLKAAEYSRFPTLTAAAGVDYAGQTPGALSSGWSVGAVLKLPVFSWGQIDNQIAQERSQVAIDESRLEQERQATSARWVQALAEANANRQARIRFSEILAESREAARAASSKYSRGADTILEATDALTLWKENLSSERSSYFSYLSALASLERISGKKYRVIYVP